MESRFGRLFGVIAVVVALSSHRSVAAVVLASLDADGATGTSDQVREGVTVSGMVVDADSSHPVQGARVLLGSGRGRSATASLPTGVRTGDGGQFVFTQVVPGTYELSVVANGYLEWRYGQVSPSSGSHPFRVRPANSAAVVVVVRLWRSGAVTGTVTDDGGDPAVGVRVCAIGASALLGSPSLVKAALTDDRGVYRITQLEPGRYFIAAIQTHVTETSPQGPKLADQPTQWLVDKGIGVALGPIVREGREVVYMTTFVPDATQIQDAQPVMVTGGETPGAWNIRMASDRAVRIEGSALGREGRVPGVSLHLMPVGDPPEPMEVASTITDASGRFVFLGVPPGQYDLRTDAPATTTTVTTSQATNADGQLQRTTSYVSSPLTSSDGAPLAANLPITVGGEDIRALQLELRSLPSLAGSVRLDGAKPPPSDLRTVKVIADRIGRRGTASTTVDAKGQFAFRGLMPGRYLLSVAPTANWTLRSVVLNGVDVSRVPLELSVASNVSDAVLTLTDRHTGVEGSVRLGSDPNTDVTVFVFPSDAKLWTLPVGRPATMLTVVVSALGRFSTPLRPGEYLLVAVDRPFFDEDWRGPAVLEHLSHFAVRVSLQEGDLKSEMLPVISLR